MANIRTPRLIPGLMTIEVVTLGFPIYAMFKNKKAAREVNNALADFDQKRVKSFEEGTTFDGSGNSLTTKASTKGSKKGRMYAMESLDVCLNSNHDGLQVYASCMELNGENIIFLTKVIAFSQQCQAAFYETCKSTTEFRRARTAMFRAGLSIFVSLVHSGTASYPINIESHIYTQLDLIFGPATALVASVTAIASPSSSSSSSCLHSPSIATPVSATSKVTPWDDPADDHDMSTEPTPTAYFSTVENSYPLRALGRKKSSGAESRERIVHVRENEVVVVMGGGSGGGGNDEGGDPLEGVTVPADFDERVFDAAFKSVRFMVWTETWQRYMHWKRRSSGSEVGD